MAVLGIIPARGGSKGLPGKNIRPFCGKPLIAWTIEAAQASRRLDRVVLSSDDPEIIRVAKEYGCETPFIRPDHLGEDGSLAIDVVLHAIEQLPDYNMVVLLQPTSPLRQAADIDACIDQYIATKSKTCVSVTLCQKDPHWMFYRSNAGKLQAVMHDERLATSRRQDWPPSFVLNGAVYVADKDFLKTYRKFLDQDTTSYVMPIERSIDIDSLFDFEMAEFIQKRKTGDHG
jgi:CMP-N,N'-diacetyllegionaminic acid synthase